MTMLFVWAAILYGFSVGLWKYAIKPAINGFHDRWQEIYDLSGNDDTSDLNRIERIENYDRQIDGYTQLIKLLDIDLQNEPDTRRKAAILSKQLITLEKLNKTIEKREKLDSSFYLAFSFYIQW